MDLLADWTQIITHYIRQKCRNRTLKGFIMPNGRIVDISSKIVFSSQDVRLLVFNRWVLLNCWLYISWFNILITLSQRHQPKIWYSQSITFSPVVSLNPSHIFSNLVFRTFKLPSFIVKNTKCNFSLIFWYNYHFENSSVSVSLRCLRVRLCWIVMWCFDIVQVLANIHCYFLVIVSSRPCRTHSILNYVLRCLQSVLHSFWFSRNVAMFEIILFSLY